MNKVTKYVLFGLVGLSACQESPKDEVSIPEGILRCELLLNDSITLPFLLEFPEEKHEHTIYLINEKEEFAIKSEHQSRLGDTLVLQTPVFLTKILLWPDQDGWKGEWQNIARNAGYKVPIVTSKGENRFERTDNSDISLSGDWKVVFGDEDPSYGLASFQQDGNSISGSIRTETGDYRFLEGTAQAEMTRIVTFDVAHAYVFDIEFIGVDSLKGRFYSGNHWSDVFYMVRDSSFQLANPDSLTHIREGFDGLEYSFSDLNGDTVHYPSENLLGKVVIVQIMGSWCPNCMDESVFFKKLYSRYRSEGLEIMAVAFERCDDLEDARPHIENMIKDLGLTYTVLYGGKANRAEAAKKFPALDHLLSFPTSIFIDRTGNVRRIHTGFNGPGTGEAYSQYVQETNDLIKEMLRE